jgi:hypothetical protein
MSIVQQFRAPKAAPDYKARWAIASCLASIMFIGSATLVAVWIIGHEVDFNELASFTTSQSSH